jgi:flagellar hook-associated protein 3 FlgL
MSMQARVTGNSIASRVLVNLNQNLSKVSDLQEQLSSGKQINRPSDSPTGTISALQLRSEMRTLDQYGRNAADGLNWLSTLDSTLTGSLGQVNRVRDLTLQGMSAGAGGSPEAREAIAVEVDNIRDSLITLSNTSYLGRPVFGGTTAGAVAFNSDGSYAGNDSPVLRTIGDGDPVQVDANGEKVFGTGDNQLFTVLADISRSLRTDPSQLAGNLDRLDTATATIKTQLSDIGARYNRVEQMRTTATDRLITLGAQLSDVEDIDLPATIMEMQMQQTAYQAALAATAKVIQPSLLDFLR